VFVRVAVNFLNKNKIELEQYNDICFMRFPRQLPKGTQYLQYIPASLDVKKDLGAQYVKFLKTLWFMRKTLWGLDIDKVMKRGMILNVDKYTMWEAYVTMVSLRYLDEMKPVLGTWETFCQWFTPWQAFVIAHNISVGGLYHNSNHTLMSSSSLPKNIETITHDDIKMPEITAPIREHSYVYTYPGKGDKPLKLFDVFGYKGNGRC
jgi:hypothetical protein